jgi:hypothetical protein
MIAGLLSRVEGRALGFKLLPAVHHARRELRRERRDDDQRVPLAEVVDRARFRRRGDFLSLREFDHAALDQRVDGALHVVVALVGVST